MFALFSSDECYTACSQIPDQGQEGTEGPTLQMLATHTAKLGSQTEKPQLSGSYTVDQGGGVLVPQLNKETGFPHVLRNSLWEHSGRESYVDIFHTQCQHLPSNQRKALPPPLRTHPRRPLPLPRTWDTGIFDMAVLMSNNTCSTRTSSAPYSDLL